MKLGKHSMRRKPKWAKRFSNMFISVCLIVCMLFLPLAPTPALYAEGPTAQTQDSGTPVPAETSISAPSSSPTSDATPSSAASASSTTSVEPTSAATSVGGQENTTAVPAAAADSTETPAVASATVAPVEQASPSAEPTAVPAQPVAVASAQSAPPEATVSPTTIAPTGGTSATTTTEAQSGDTLAAGVIVDNQVDNTEVASSVSHGGDGAVAATNNFTGTVAQTGAAGTSSGFAGAIGGDASSTAGNTDSSVTAEAQSGQAIAGAEDTIAEPDSSPNGSSDNTTASTSDLSSTGCSFATTETSSESGAAAAAGLLVDNNVDSTLISSVAVGGENQGIVNVTNNAETTIVNQGVGIALSGQSTATGGSGTASSAFPMTYSLNPVVTTTVQSSSSGSASTIAISPSTTVIGLETTNNVNNTQTISGTVNGADGQSNGAVITQTAIIANRGSATAATNMVAATSTGTTNSAADGTSPSAVADSTTTAVSGDGIAVGVNAKNNVSTTAVTDVRVEGSNYSIINVVVTSLVQIVNIGQALAQSGSTNADGGNATAVAGGAASNGNEGKASAQSGDASATGVKATNNISASSDAQITVVGDNKNPLTIVIDLIVGVFNQGQATARTGNATADASGGSNNSASVASANSGDADATGVDVENNVDLRSRIAVLVKGSNYAPINITVRLISLIVNIGTANAKSGQAAATGGDVVAGTNSDSSDVEYQTQSQEETVLSSGGDGVNTVAMSSSASSQNDVTDSSTIADIDGVLQQMQSWAANALSVTTAKSGDSLSVGNANNTDLNNTQVAIAGQGPGDGTTIAQNIASFYVLSSGVAVANSGNAATGTIIDPDKSTNGDQDDSTKNNPGDSTNTDQGGSANTDQGGSAKTDPGKQKSDNHTNIIHYQSSTGSTAPSLSSKLSPWPYPWALGMPGLSKTKRVAGLSTPGYTTRSTKSLWSSRTLPRPDGLVKGLSREVPLTMPDVEIGNGSNDLIPPWLNLLGLALGVVSVTGFTGYRYRRQLMPLVNSLFTALASIF